ncbi:MAG: ASCH domain-containing protein [Bacilli bacterium]
MDKQAMDYWTTYWNKKNTEAPTAVSAWQFGASPDELAQLVIDGVKTATCSGQLFYEREGEPLPAVDDYSIILNSKDEPVAIIRTVNVEVMPMNEVSEAFAAAEGEGDRSYQYWWDAHVAFFTRELEAIGETFQPDLRIVCERFELVDVKL